MVGFLLCWWFGLSRSHSTGARKETDLVSDNSVCHGLNIHQSRNDQDTQNELNLYITSHIERRSDVPGGTFHMSWRSRRESLKTSIAFGNPKSFLWKSRQGLSTQMSKLSFFTEQRHGGPQRPTHGGTDLCQQLSLTRSPPIGWARQNAVPLKSTQPSEAAFSSFFAARRSNSF